MGKRLVMDIKTGESELGMFKKFITDAEKYGVKISDLVQVNSVEDRVIFSVDLPKDVTVVSGKPVKVKRKTKKQERVEKQIEEHQEKKENGKTEAYVPPVGRTTRPPVKKLKCPECNVRKQVVTVAGIKMIRAHTIKGDACPGSGTQVLGKGNKMHTFHPLDVPLVPR